MGSERKACQLNGGAKGIEHGAAGGVMTFMPGVLPYV
jgi:hypothetical protein